MTKTGDYIDQIRELIQKMGLPEVARALSTTERGVMYWIADKDPKIPRRETIKKIHELFMNQKTGQGIASNESTEPKKESTEVVGVSMQVLADLTKSNLNISESNKSIGRAHEILVQKLEGRLDSDDRLLLRDTAIAVKKLRETFESLLSELKNQKLDETRKIFHSKTKERDGRDNKIRIDA